MVDEILDPEAELRSFEPRTRGKKHHGCFWIACGCPSPNGKSVTVIPPDGEDEDCCGVDLNAIARATADCNSWRSTGLRRYPKA